MVKRSKKERGRSKREEIGAYIYLYIRGTSVFV